MAIPNLRKAFKSNRANPKGPLPTFLIIGAQKSGTRWLRANLGEHPEIYAAPKELWFFNNVQKRFHGGGVDWYRAQFESWDGEPFVGEATPGYLMPRHDPKLVAKRIGRVVPDVRLIAILRNPIDRANSAMIHQIKRRRLPTDTRLLDFVRQTALEDDRFELVAAGHYASLLRPYVDRFGDQLLVLLHDDIAADAEHLYRTAARHIGASTDFVPPELPLVRYSNRDRVNAGQRELAIDERVAIYDCFRADVERLGELLERDLSRWDPSIALPADQSGSSTEPA